MYSTRVDSSIAVVGVGGLGGRHLQALKGLSSSADLYISDPESSSVERALGWYQHAPGTGATPEVAASLGDLPSELDVVVVATPSDVRRRVVEELLENRSVRYLVLEKVLFQHMGDVRAVGDLLERTGTEAWVNCPRRMWPFYSDLRALLEGASGVGVHVTGADWGLGCNGIHFLDLAAFLAGKPVTRVDAQFSDGVRQAKRPGYSEYHGTLWGHEGADTVVVTSLRGDADGITIHITSDRACAHIREVEGTAWIATADEGWEWREQPFDLPFQSQLTHHVVDQLLQEGTCSLTPYPESAQLHELFLGALSAHHTVADTATGIQLCPIT